VNTIRLRRLRQDERFRELIRETELQLNQFVLPYFVVEGKNIKKEIPSMPGVFQFSIDQLLKDLETLEQTGLNSILLFGVSTKKDETASQSWNQEGIIPTALKEIKKRFPKLLVMTDVCLCAYTSHGHCGLIEKNGDGGSFQIENDKSVEALAKMALIHAEAGADLVSPSDMMDGRVKAIRQKLDQAGFKNLPIMSYSVKFASNFYGPFRDAAESPPNLEIEGVTKWMLAMWTKPCEKLL